MGWRTIGWRMKKAILMEGVENRNAITREWEGMERLRWKGKEGWKKKKTYRKVKERKTTTQQKGIKNKIDKDGGGRERNYIGEGKHGKK